MSVRSDVPGVWGQWFDGLWYPLWRFVRFRGTRVDHESDGGFMKWHLSGERAQSSITDA